MGLGTRLHLTNHSVVYLSCASGNGSVDKATSNKPFGCLLVMCVWEWARGQGYI